MHLNHCHGLAGSCHAHDIKPPHLCMPLGRWTGQPRHQLHLPLVPPIQGAGPANHIITFFRNGFFTVNDGPGRNVNDPANFKFIDSISKVCARSPPTI